MPATTAMAHMVTAAIPTAAGTHVATALVMPTAVVLHLVSAVLMPAAVTLCANWVPMVLLGLRPAGLQVLGQLASTSAGEPDSDRQ